MRDAATRKSVSTFFSPQVAVPDVPARQPWCLFPPGVRVPSCCGLHRVQRLLPLGFYLPPVGRHVRGRCWSWCHDSCGTPGTPSSALPTTTTAARTSHFHQQHRPIRHQRLLHGGHLGCKVHCTRSAGWYFSAGKAHCNKFKTETLTPQMWTRICRGNCFQQSNKFLDSAQQNKIRVSFSTKLLPLSILSMKERRSQKGHWT